jgi:hypothetical protein
VSGVKFRIVAFGDDDWDIVYIDDVQVRGMLKNDQPIEAPTPSPMNLVNNQCTENSGSWPNFFTATFNVGGGSLYIGEAFEKLVDGGNAQKLPGVGEDGSATVRLRVRSCNLLEIQALKSPNENSLFIILMLFAGKHRHFSHCY